MTTTPSVLFVCVKNGGRSQMAAGLMRHAAGTTVTVESAGTKPGTAVNALSARSLQELGIDITAETPKAITEQMVRDADVVITLGREATSSLSTAPASRAGTPTNPPSAASTASNACASCATTSPPASTPSGSSCATAATRNPRPPEGLLHGQVTADLGRRS